MRPADFKSAASTIPPCPPQSPQRFSEIRGCQSLPNRGRPGNPQTAISGPVSASYGSFSQVICSTCRSRLVTRFAAHGSGKDEGLRPQHRPGPGPLDSSEQPQELPLAKGPDGPWPTGWSPPLAQCTRCQLKHRNAGGWLLHSGNLAKPCDKGKPFAHHKTPNLLQVRSHLPQRSLYLPSRHLTPSQQSCNLHKGCRTVTEERQSANAQMRKCTDIGQGMATVGFED